MASAFYATYKTILLTTGGINLLTDTIKAQLVDAADYTPNLATDNFLNDIPALARVGTAQTLASKTVVGNVFDAADLSYTAVTGDGTEHVAIFKDTGVESTSNLIALIDGAVTPTGVDITLVWDNGPNKIFAL
jgi:hypothetical protein